MDLRVCSIALEETCCPMLLLWGRLPVGVDVEFAPASLSVGRVENNMPQLVGRALRGYLVVSGEGVED